MSRPGCLNCGFYDLDREGCTCPSGDRWYACPIESRKPENQKDLRMIANEHIEEYFMGKANPLPPEDMPEDIIAVTRWGGGNYYLEDRELGKTIRITPDVFWAILEKVHEAMKVAQLNGVEV